MPEVQIRKITLALEEIWHEGGPPAPVPRRRAAVLAAIRNPFAGRYVADIQPFMADLKPLGRMMAGRLLAALGGDAALIDGYGKGALIGEAGELEHGALWHEPGGYAMREALGGANGRASAIVASTKKVCGLGGRLDVPVTHVQASYVRSHFDGMEVGMPDGPRADEMVLVLVMTCGPRVHDRAGGLAAGDITGKDGLR